MIRILLPSPVTRDDRSRSSRYACVIVAPRWFHAYFSFLLYRFHQRLLDRIPCLLELLYFGLPTCTSQPVVGQFVLGRAPAPNVRPSCDPRGSWPSLRLESDPLRGKVKLASFLCKSRFCDEQGPFRLELDVPTSVCMNRPSYWAG